MKKAGGIDACPLFQNLKEEERVMAMEFFHARSRSFKKGESLKYPGEPLGFFGYMLSGNVEVYMDDTEGNHLVMAYAEAGDTFGESLCYLGKPNPVGITAVTDCLVLLMDCRNLSQPQTDPAEAQKYASRFTAMLASRTLSMNRRIQVLSRMSIRDKLLTFFLGQQAAGQGKNFEISMDREHLAAYLGVNRSALSRELSRMKEEGLIDYYRNTFRILK